jgi:two-component system LytT family response regulator
VGKARALIVDDEPLARRGIRELLSRDKEISIVGECRDGIEAIETLQEGKTDILFLDVEMPTLNGFEVLDAVPSPPVVIFVTAFDQYAVEAFSIHAFDYLLKPVDPDRFMDALARAKSALLREQEQSHAENLRKLLSSIRKRQRRNQRIAVKTAGKIHLIETADIDWIEAAGDYVSLHVRAKKYLLRETVRAIEQRLEPGLFLRIHRSTIVNTSRIKEIAPMPHGEYRLLLTDGTSLSVSRTFRAGISALLDSRA